LVLRSLLASLTGVLAAVLLPLGLLSVWTHGVVSDTDTYVETVAPLADDDVVKAAAVTELEREALQLVAGRGTPPRGVEAVVHLVVQHVVDGPAFRDAWMRANRAAHEQLVAVLDGRASARLDAQGRVSIDLAAAFAAIAQDLAAQGLVDAERAAEVDASFAVMDGDRLGKVRHAYDLLDALGFWLPLAWAAMVLLTLLPARRRASAVAKLAVASLVATAVLALAVVSARDLLTDDLAQRDVARAVWSVVVADLWRAIEVAGVALAIVALGAAVAAGVTGRVRPPSGPGPDGERSFA
jgi:hypothetical protein